MARHDCCFFLSIPMAAFRPTDTLYTPWSNFNKIPELRGMPLLPRIQPVSGHYFSFVFMSLMFVTLLGGYCTFMQGAPGVWIDSGGAILMLAREGVVHEADGCSFDGGTGFLRSTITLVSGALALIIYICIIEGGYPGGTSLRSAHIPTAFPTAAGNLHIFLAYSHTFLHGVTAFKSQNMDLLVAGLREIEPYGLYQYDSSVDRKQERKDI